MWRAALGSSGRRDLLDAVTQSHGGWHEALYGDAIEPLAFVELPNTRAAWQRSSQWLQALRTGSRPDGLAVETTALLGAIWRLRLEQPEQAANALDVANSLLCGKPVRVPLGSPGGAPPLENIIAQARLARLLERWRRIQQILSDATEDGLRAAIAGPVLPPAERAGICAGAVAGRVSRGEAAHGHLGQDGGPGGERAAAAAGGAGIPGRLSDPGAGAWTGSRRRWPHPRGRAPASATWPTCCCATTRAGPGSTGMRERCWARTRFWKPIRR